MAKRGNVWGKKLNVTIQWREKNHRGKNFMEAKEGWGKIWLHQNAHTLLQKEVALLTGKAVAIMFHIHIITYKKCFNHAPTKAWLKKIQVGWIHIYMSPNLPWQTKHPVICQPVQQYPSKKTWPPTWQLKTQAVSGEIFFNSFTIESKESSLGAFSSTIGILTFAYLFSPYWNLPFFWSNAVLSAHGCLILNVLQLELLDLRTLKTSTWYIWVGNQAPTWSSSTSSLSSL